MIARLLAWFAPSALATAAAVGAALLAALGAQTWRLHSTQAALADARTQTAQVKFAWAQDRQQTEAQAAKTQAEYRNEEQRRVRQRQEVNDEAQRQSTRARADAAGAAAADGGLRNAARTVAASCRPSASNPAAVASGPADRLADVLAESTSRYREVAEAADRAVVAGQICVGSYDALTPTTIALPRMRLGEL